MGRSVCCCKNRIYQEKPVIYREALIGIEELEGVQKDDIFGFAVDAGLGCITDPEVVPYVDKFIEELDVENIYDDYFAELFAKSYQEDPRNQRDLGDWINWNIPVQTIISRCLQVVLEMGCILCISDTMHREK
jgi:hypothetical protein